MTSPKFVSLFSGCGGFDLGFAQAGFEPVAAYDFWPAAVENYRRNIGGHTEVRDLSAKKLVLDGTCDVLLSGSPCQGFSTVGRRDLDDPRNRLLGAAVSAAQQLKPKAVVIENVPGVRFGAHKSYWITAIRGLEALGYAVQEVSLQADEFGIPQARTRVMLIATKGRIAPTLHFESRPKLMLGDALNDIKTAHNHNPRILSADSSDGKISRRIAVGQKLCDVRGGASSIHTWSVPEVFGATSAQERLVLEKILVLRRRNRVRSFGDADPVAIALIANELSMQERVAESIVRTLEEKLYVRRPDGLVDLKRTFNGKYRRLDSASPSPTVHTQFGEPKYFLHPAEHRGYTVREAARIQSFPDNYVFSGSVRDQYKMIGNAVPPPLGFAVAMSLRNAISGWSR